MVRQSVKMCKKSPSVLSANVLVVSVISVNMLVLYGHCISSLLTPCNCVFVSKQVFFFRTGSLSMHYLISFLMLKCSFDNFIN
jgi:hypothetical protein